MQEVLDSTPKASVVIGGDKGHIQEEIDGNLARLYQAFRWKPLPNCTGRYTCRDHKKVSMLTPAELLQTASIPDSFEHYAFQLPGRTDPVGRRSTAR